MPHPQRIQRSILGSGSDRAPRRFANLHRYKTYPDEERANPRLDSFLEFLARMMRTDLGREDKLADKQIEQYFNPQSDVFPRQLQRPQDLTKYGDRPFYSLGDYRPTAFQRRSDPITFTDKDLPFSIPQYAAFPVAETDIERRAIRGRYSTLPEHQRAEGELFQEGQDLGLGRYIASIGKDDRGYYLSNFDSWDFDPWNNVSIRDPKGMEISEGSQDNAVDPFSSEILRNVGTPYNFYDRYYFTPDTIGEGPSRRLSIPSFFRAE